MSNWLHVAAIVRIDSFGGLFEDESECLTKEMDSIKNVFGRQLLFDDHKAWEEYREHPERFLPMGSEGSLQMSLWINPKDYMTARYTVSIFGDLRDRFNCQSIIDWFKDRCNRMECWTIRNACITVDNELSTYVCSASTHVDDVESDAPKIVWIETNDEKH